VFYRFSHLYLNFEDIYLHYSYCITKQYYSLLYFTITIKYSNRIFTFYDFLKENAFKQNIKTLIIKMIYNFYYNSK